MTIHFMFNAESKEFIGISPDRSILNDNIIYHNREIPSDSIFEYTWIGDYDTGKMSKIGESPAIREEDLEEELYTKLFSKYSIERLMCLMLNELPNSDLIHPDLLKSKQLYKKLLEKFYEKRKYYSESPEYIFKPKS